MGLRPMSASKIASEDLLNSRKIPLSILNSDQLFNLTCDLYMNNPPHEDLLKPIEQTLSAAGQLLILNGNHYLYPKGPSPIAAEKIWETARIDTSGIFRQKIKILDGNHESESILFTIYLGKNSADNEMAAGILQVSNRALSPDREHCLYGFLGCLKRYYSEFSISPSLNNFIRNKSALRYVVNAATNEIIATMSPSDGNLTIDPKLTTPQLFNEFQVRLSDAEIKRIKQMSSDKRRGNISISNCTIMGNDYIIISLGLTHRAAKSAEKDGLLIEDVTGKIRGELNAIQNAVGQLSLQKGRLIDENDIALAGIIRSSSDSLNQLIERLNYFSRGAASEESSVDNNRVGENIISGKNMESDSSPETRYPAGSKNDVLIEVDLSTPDKEKLACVGE